MPICRCLLHKPLLSLAAASLTACASLPASQRGAPQDPHVALIAAAHAGQWATLSEGLLAPLRKDPGNGALHLLKGLAQQRLSEQDASQTELAGVAYQNAETLAPGSYWANLLRGTLLLRQGRAEAALAPLAAAAADEEATWQAEHALAVAAWQSGDLALARLAAERLKQRQAGEPAVWRLAALTEAAAGEGSAMASAQQAFLAGDTEEQARLLRRVQHLVALAGDAPPALGDLAVTAAEAPAVGAEQITVEVTIILSSALKNERRGVNLLDALRITYSQERTSNRTRTVTGTDAPIDTATRTILQGIGIPQLNYSLNLFNDSGQYYSVLARPSLTAFINKQSDFFAGRTVNVQVSGVNLGQLQPIDVGVGLKVTPETIGPDKTRVRIEASRSFLSREEVDNFEQSLTTFKQAVNATAEIAFGETLVLSALSETIRDSNVSKVPLLGDVPLISSLTSERNTLDREETLLVLLTPQRPAGFATAPAPRAESLQRLMRLWQRDIDPNSSFDDVLRRLERLPTFKKAQKSDFHTALPGERELFQQALDQTLREALPRAPQPPIALLQRSAL